MRPYIALALVLALAGCSSAPRQPVEEKKKASGPTYEKAPAEYKVDLDTSKGKVVIAVHRDWAPNGADRFFELVQQGYFDEARFFRVLKGFVAQFGINKDPKISELWRQLAIPDDRVKQPNKRGTVTFAMRGPNTRTTQVFINLRDNLNLDRDGFAPFGEVVEGMDIVDQFYSGYGEGLPRGNGPDQNRIQALGNQYLEQSFPRLDYIKSAKIVR
jgi:peptidyl-prolyl cis-trans isomerase A (cyclophilin A)